MGKNKTINFLMGLFGPDIFSIIHKYTGQIIEKVSPCICHNFMSLSEKERDIIRSGISECRNTSTHWLNNKIIYKTEINIDNIFYKIYSIDGKCDTYYNKKYFSLFVSANSKMIITHYCDTEIPLKNIWLNVYSHNMPNDTLHDIIIEWYRKNTEFFYRYQSPYVDFNMSDYWQN